MLLHRIQWGINEMSAERALQLATIGSASLIGRQDEIGSLEVGKLADFAMINVNRLEFAGAAIHDPLAALVFCGRNFTVDWAVVNGKIRVENKMIISPGWQEQELIDRANRVALAMRQQASRRTGLDFLKKTKGDGCCG